MGKNLPFLLIVFFIISLFCASAYGQSSPNTNMETGKLYKTDLDREFDRGSNITFTNLSEKTIEDLVLLGKIWGFAKYYHPVIASGQYNWDYELFRILPKVISCGSKEERNSVLYNWVKKIGEIKKVRTREIKDSSRVRLFPDLAWISDKSELGDSLSASLTRIRDAERDSSHYYFSFHKVSGNPVFTNERAYDSLAYPDAGFRILSLFRYWNIVNYLSPYKYRVDGNWNEILKGFLPKFINSKDELGYRLTVMELITKLRDTHANIQGKDKVFDSYRGTNISALIVNFVEGKPVITGYFDEELGKKSGLKKGDIILSINNENVSDIVKKKLPYASASNEAQKFFRIALGLLRTNDNYLSLSYERNGKVYENKIECYPLNTINVGQIMQQKIKCWKFLKDDIGYIYPGSIRKDSLEKIMSEFKNTKGIVIDMRCYPGDYIVFAVGNYFFPAQREFMKISHVSMDEPGLFTFSEAASAGSDNPQYYKGKVIVLVNEVTLSQAEMTTMSLRASPNTLVIGGTTAGADGDVSLLALPGGVRTMITGTGIYYPDGKETQGMGIIPDIMVTPTIKGITEGRDELLEKAIELISAK